MKKTLMTIIVGAYFAVIGCEQKDYTKTVTGTVYIQEFQKFSCNDSSGQSRQVDVALIAIDSIPGRPKFVLAGTNELHDGDKVHLEYIAAKEISAKSIWDHLYPNLTTNVQCPNKTFNADGLVLKYTKEK
ncbi:MAG: hypothetical protein V1837_07720 [Candidatus Woesearchaeota archaeon]